MTHHETLHADRFSAVERVVCGPVRAARLGRPTLGGVVDVRATISPDRFGRA